MPSFQIAEQTEQYIISAKNDTPYEDLTVDKRKNDKRSMKDMFNFKKVLSFGTLESSKNFLAQLQETLEEKEQMKMKIKSFYPVKIRMKYLNSQFSTLENCFTNDIHGVEELFPELFKIRGTTTRFNEEDTKFKQSFILVDMITRYKHKCKELHDLKNNLEETTIKECNEKIEYYKNQRDKEFHKTDLYLEMNEEILNLESNREHLLETLTKERERNKEILQEKRALEQKLKSYSQEEDALTMRTLEMNKTEREVREENKKLKKQVEKFKIMIMDTM